MSKGSTVGLLQLLIDNLVPRSGKETVDFRERLLWTAVGILDSTRDLAPLAKDELAISEALRHKLLKVGKDAAADRLWHNHQQLIKCGWLASTRWSFFVLLHLLSDSNHGGTDQQELTNQIQEKGLLREPVPFGVHRAPVTHATVAHQWPAHLPAQQHRLMEPHSISEVTEEKLVRDCVFAAQGIEGTYIRFTPAEEDSDGDVLCEIEGGSVEHQIVRKISELGWLSRRVQSLCDTSLEDDGKGKGRVSQAFCCAAQQEIQQHLKLMAYLESFLASPIPKAGVQQPGSAGGAPYLTLRRLMPWLRPSLQRMRLLAGMADVTTTVRGGALISCIQGFSQHGDQEVRKFVVNMLRQVCVPLFEMIKDWVFEGRLNDGYHEFFIRRDESAMLIAGEALALQDSRTDYWMRGYIIQASMKPAFISDDLAEKILKTGKSINFLRECCNDAEWVVGRDRAALEASAAKLSYGQESSLERVVRDAYTLINKHLMDVLYSNYHFEKHCIAIKRYLLLGQGDFIQALMDGIGSDLNRRAVDISEYTLNASLDAAIRSSNAQYDDPDVMDRLRIRLDKATGVETGWDVFMLHYDVTQPLSTIFHKETQGGYLRMFRLLWGIKRVEHSLNSDWKLMTIIERKLGQQRVLTRQNAIMCPGLDGVWSELRHGHRVLSEMSHFVTNLQYYLHFEVMEASWQQFCKNLKGASDLDSLVKAHEDYIHSILSKALLSQSTLNESKAMKTDVQRELQLTLRSILDLAGPIKRLNEMVTASELEIRAYIREIEESALTGEWNMLHCETDLKGIPNDQLMEIHDLVRRINITYSKHQQMFVQLMAAQAHVDTQSFIYRMRSTKEHSRGSFSGNSTPRLMG